MIQDDGRVASPTGSHASHEAPAGLRPPGFDPSREPVGIPVGMMVAFVRESNRIEGIDETTEAHIRAHYRFLAGALTITGLVGLVKILQPDARLRNKTSVPGVRVGKHIAPPSGPQIETWLRSILAMRDPWKQHVDYETLQPFTDGNGRSGRALWLHRYFHEPSLDPWAIRRGFLHSFYYHAKETPNEIS